MITKNTICTNDVLENNAQIKDKFHLVRYVCKRVKELNVGVESRLNYILKFKSNVDIAIQEIYFNLYPNKTSNHYTHLEDLESIFKMQSNQLLQNKSNSINYFLEEAQFFDRAEEAALELDSELDSNSEIANLIEQNDTEDSDIELDLDLDLESTTEESEK